MQALRAFCFKHAQLQLQVYRLTDSQYLYQQCNYSRPNTSAYLRSTPGYVTNKVQCRKIQSPSKRAKISLRKSTEMNKGQRKQENHPPKCSARSTRAKGKMPCVRAVESKSVVSAWFRCLFIVALFSLGRDIALFWIDT